MYHAPAKSNPLAILMSGIDTVQLGYYGTLRPEVHAFLRERHEAALKTREQGSPRGLPVEVGGVLFELRPHSSKRGRYILQNADLGATVADFSSKQFPTLHVQLRSSCLWRLSARRAVEAVRTWAGEVLEGPREVLSRADLAVDFQGWGPRADEVGHYVGRSAKRAAYEDGQAFTGIQFGKGDIVARHYDKSAEIRRTHKDWYPPIWQTSPAYRPGQPVARMEFQFRRGAFRSFSPRIQDFRDLWERRSSLWRYATGDWLTFRMPSRTRRANWPVHPFWRAIQNQGFEGTTLPLIRERRRKAVEDQLIPQMTGCLSTLAALSGRETLPEALEYLAEKIGKYLESREIDFGQRVKLKQFRHAEITRDSRVENTRDNREDS